MPPTVGEEDDTFEFQDHQAVGHPRAGPRGPGVRLPAEHDVLDAQHVDPGTGSIAGISAIGKQRVIDRVAVPGQERLLGLAIERPKRFADPIGKMSWNGHGNLLGTRLP